MAARVPYAYQEVKYIKSTGTQYINTGFTHTVNTRIEMDCKVGANTSSSYQALFGARLSSYKTNSMCLFTRFNNENLPYYSRSGAETKGSGFVYNEDITVIAEGTTATWYKNGVSVGSVTTTGTADNGVTPMFLFNLNTASASGGATPDTSYEYDMIMYSCRIYDNDVLMRDYVPCYRKSDNVAGIYDLVSKTFLVNSGTGTFEIGEECNIVYKTLQSGMLGRTNVIEGMKIRVGERWPNNTALLMHFDDNLNDETGNNVPAAQGTLTYNEGKFGKAAVFTGSNVVKMDNTSFTFGSDDFTVAAWIYPTSTTTAHYSEILSRCCYYNSSYTGSGFNLWILGTSGNERKVHVGVYTSYSSSVSVTSSTQINLNEWTHVAVVRSGTTLSLYVNGVLEGAATVSGSVYSGGTVRPIMIGGRSKSNNTTADTDWFFGSIDEVLIAKEAIWTENFEPPKRAYK